MFLYDWNKIFEASNGNPLLIYLIFKMMAQRTIPKNRRDRLYRFAGLNFRGESFLVHPDLLIYHSYKYEHREIAQYLALAAHRPYADYLATGKTTLDYRTVEYIDKDYIDNNRLLHMGDDQQIHFLYEEAKMETIH